MSTQGQMATVCVNLEKTVSLKNLLIHLFDVFGPRQGFIDFKLCYMYHLNSNNKDKIYSHTRIFRLFGNFNRKI